MDERKELTEKEEKNLELAQEELDEAAGGFFDNLPTVPVNPIDPVLREKV